MDHTQALCVCLWLPPPHAPPPSSSSVQSQLQPGEESLRVPPQQARSHQEAHIGVRPAAAPPRRRHRCQLNVSSQKNNVQQLNSAAELESIQVPDPLGRSSHERLT